RESGSVVGAEASRGPGGGGGDSLAAAGGDRGGSAHGGSAGVRVRGGAGGGWRAQKPRECRAEVAAVRWPRPEVIEVDLRMVDPPEFVFEAGQWISVPFGPKGGRGWTIWASPTRRRER